MSDLEDAIDWMATWPFVDDGAAKRDLVVEVARKYANPDYEAMLRILWEHFYEDMEGNPSDPDEAWEYNKEWSKIQMSGLPERLWAAALGVTEPK